jgi:hypothetical protein
MSKYTIHFQMPPIDALKHVEIRRKLNSCCPWRIQKYYLRRLVCYGKNGFCNAPNCWVWIDRNTKHSHERDNPRTMCTNCKGAGYFHTLMLTNNSYGTFGRENCFICKGKGYHGGFHSSPCYYCKLHCPQ